MYFVCHFWDGGDDFWVSSCKEAEDVVTYIKTMKLAPNDYYIIKGQMLKGIDNTSFDLKNFKENEHAKTDGNDE